MSKYSNMNGQRSSPAYNYEGHYNGGLARGTSPHRATSGSSSKNSKKLPSHHHGHTANNGIRKTRSLSPFGGGSGSPRRGNNGSGSSVIVCHESAHAVVFRDSVRLARKIIQEEEHNTWDHEDDDGEQWLNSGQNKESGASSSNSSEENNFDQAPAMKRSSTSHGSGNAAATTKVVQNELHNMAKELVPEIKAVTLDLKNVSERNIEIEGLHAHISPLQDLEWNQKTHFEPLAQAPAEPPNDTEEEAGAWTEAEVEVYTLLKNQQACVKTIQKNEWPSFLQRFQTARQNNNGSSRAPATHDDLPPNMEQNRPFNSFVTSTSLLPELGKKMRCYGSDLSYPVGVVFALPSFDSPEAEAQAVQETETWAWPAGYAAKTEFNIDHKGRLINGRQEALVSLQQMRQYNHEYVHNKDHYIAGRIIKGGFKVVPYNECFLRVGGYDRIVQGKSVTTQQSQQRTLQKGCGLFVALFIRSTTMGDIVNLFRTRARIAHVLGHEHVENIPLLYLHHEVGVRVFTKQLQQLFWKQASCMLQPYMNPTYALTTRYHETNDKSLQYKLDEQMELDAADLRQALSHHELAKIAGGFGVSDASFLTLLTTQPDFQHVHDVMQQGFAAAIRAGDYYGARQSLILYALANTFDEDGGNGDVAMMQEALQGVPATMYVNLSVLHKKEIAQVKLPKPLATKRWRRATNSDGLLVVLGAAQILKTISTTSAKRRTEESYEAVEEWVQHGEESVAFRVASWREQRADEADSNIAMSNDSKFWAFVTDKSVHNRRKFAQQLRKAAPADDFTPVRFLRGIYDIVEHMHSPCMRLELLQFILALDNRYSVELIKESIELAASCLSLVPHGAN